MAAVADGGGGHRQRSGAEVLGRYEPGYEALAHRFGRFVFPAAVEVWTRPLGANVALVGDYWRYDIYAVFDIAREAVVWLVVLVSIGVMYRARRASALLLAPPCLLPLYVLGTDHARWCELAFDLLMVAVAFAVCDRRRVGDTLDRPVVRLLMLALIGLPFVPFGIEHAFQSLPR